MPDSSIGENKDGSDPEQRQTSGQSEKKYGEYGYQELDVEQGGVKLNYAQTPDNKTDDAGIPLRPQIQDHFGEDTTPDSLQQDRAFLIDDAPGLTAQAVQDVFVATDRQMGGPEFSESGAVAALVQVTPDGVAKVAHAGDPVVRFYIEDPKNRKILDEIDAALAHNYANKEEQKRLQITPNSGEMHFVTRSLGDNKSQSGPRPEYNEYDFNSYFEQGYEVIVVAGSDGLLDGTNKEMRIEAVQAATEDQNISGVLVKLADDNGANDNVTALAARFRAPPKANVTFGIVDGHGSNGAKAAQVVEESFKEKIGSDLRIGRQMEAEAVRKLLADQVSPVVEKQPEPMVMRRQKSPAQDNSAPGAGFISVQSEGLNVSCQSQGGGTGCLVLVHPKTGKVCTFGGRFSEAVPDVGGVENTKHYETSSDIGNTSVDIYELGEKSARGKGSKTVRQLMQEGWQVYAMAGNNDLFSRQGSARYDFDGTALALAQAVREGLTAKEIAERMERYALEQGAPGKPAAAFICVEDGEKNQLRVNNGVAEMSDKNFGSNIQKEVNMSDLENNPFGSSEKNLRKLQDFKDHGMKLHDPELSTGARLGVVFAAAVGCAFVNPLLGIAAGVGAYNATKPDSERQPNVAVATSAHVEGKKGAEEIVGDIKVKSLTYAFMHPIQTYLDYKHLKEQEVQRVVRSLDAPSV